MKTYIEVNDSTLRDGNHAISHQLSIKNIEEYCKRADLAGVPVVEVGHGNGLGASSVLVGESAIDDQSMLITARNNLKKAKLSVHAIPGFCTIKRDLSLALELGVDIFRVAAHCTEADITKRHIEFVRDNDRGAYGILMMSHMCSIEKLVIEAKKLEEYGAQAVIIMDSAGAYLPEDVAERINCLSENLSIKVGFHAHNNLGLAIANTITAIQNGACIVDASIRGFGAGAGNAQLETLIGVLERMNYQTDINLFKILNAGDYAETNFIESIPYMSSTSIISGLSGVFSGFKKPVQKAAKEYGVDPKEIFIELGRRKVVAGQESLIFEVAEEIRSKNNGPLSREICITFKSE